MQLEYDKYWTWIDQHITKYSNLYSGDLQRANYILEIYLLRVAVLEAKVLERYSYLLIDLAEKFVDAMRFIWVITWMTRWGERSVFATRATVDIVALLTARRWCTLDCIILQKNKKNKTREL